MKAGKSGLLFYVPLVLDSGSREMGQSETLTTINVQVEIHNFDEETSPSILASKELANSVTTFNELQTQNSPSTLQTAHTIDEIERRPPILIPENENSKKTSPSTIASKELPNSVTTFNELQTQNSVSTSQLEKRRNINPGIFIPTDEPMIEPDRMEVDGQDNLEQIHEFDFEENHGLIEEFHDESNLVENLEQYELLEEFDDQNNEVENIEETQELQMEEGEDTIPVKVFPKPAQEKLKNLIVVEEIRLASLERSRRWGDTQIQKREIDKLTAEIKSHKSKLKRLDYKAKNTQKNRTIKRQKELEMLEVMPDVAKVLGIRENPGRPSLDMIYPDLFKDIIDIATIGSASGDRRREEVYRTVKTLDDLHAALQGMGYQISRSGLYLHLQPRSFSTTEGKKHVKTVPVRLVKPQNDLRRGHKDRQFAAEGFKSSMQLIEFIGPHAGVFLSQDDKATVAMGITAAKRQTSMVMNINYRVRLPDHDFPKGSRHKLVPSVIGECQVNINWSHSYKSNHIILPFEPSLTTFNGFHIEIAFIPRKCKYIQNFTLFFFN